MSIVILPAKKSLAAWIAFLGALLLGSCFCLVVSSHFLITNQNLSFNGISDLIICTTVSFFLLMQDMAST
jgi:hypothetical protein